MISIGVNGIIADLFSRGKKAVLHESSAAAKKEHITIGQNRVQVTVHFENKQGNKYFKLLSTCNEQQLVILEVILIGNVKPFFEPFSQTLFRFLPISSLS